MPGPEGQLSTRTADESSLNDANTQEFGSLNTTAKYFDSWFETLKPSLALNEDLVPASPNYQQPRITSDNGAESEFTFAGTLRVDCYVKGVIPSRTGTLIVGETAEVEADIVVAIAIIDGLVRGDIHATERVELGSHARVFGNIESPALSVQPGAVFEGHCHFLSRVRCPHKSFPDVTGEETKPLAVAAGR